MKQRINTRQCIVRCQKCDDFTISTDGGPTKCYTCLPRNDAKKVIQTPAWRKKRLDVLIKNEWECFYCGERATCVDHKLPVSHGGTEDDSNLVACCRRCNNLKAMSTIPVFLERVKKLFITNRVQRKDLYRVAQIIVSEEKICG